MKRLIPFLLLLSSLLLPAARVVAAPPGPSGAFPAVGAGNGHGVGMSQWGAKGMADQGASAASILSHYYRGTGLADRAQPALRVWITDAGGGVAVTPSGPVRVTNDTGPQTASIASQATVQVEGGGLTLRQGASVLLGPVAGPLVVRFDAGSDQVPGALLRVDPRGHTYRYGQLELRSAGGSTVRAVLRNVAMERYLYGLGEVPSSWPIEAQRAQAIAARTYALEKHMRLGQFRPECSCGLFSTTADQHYVGYGKELESSFRNWQNAVDSTAGRVVTHGGAPIQAFYHSSSGGFTENSENVFTAALPYLRGVPDPGDDRASPHRGWKRSYPRTDLERWLNRFGDTSVGTLTSVETLAPYGVSGRTVKPSEAGGGVRISGSAGVKQVSGDRFRSVVNSGLAVEGRSGEQLLSTLFQFGWEPYPHGFRGGVFAAGGRDVNLGPVLVTGADQGGGPHVVVSDTSGRPWAGFFAYDTRFGGGVRVAACDLNADGLTEVVTGAGPSGGPHVRLFRLDGLALGGGFFAYDMGFTGGVYVGCGDVDGMAGDEIITGAGAGGAPHVRIFKPDGTPIGGFLAYTPHFGGGVRVAAGNFDGMPGDELVTGAGPGGGPHVRLLRADGSEVSNFFAYSPAFPGGVYVATVLTARGTSVLVGAGEGGGSHVRILRPDGSSQYEQFAFGGVMQNGVRPAAAITSSFAAGGQGTWPLVRPLP